MIKRSTIENSPLFVKYNHSVNGIDIFVNKQNHTAICFLSRRKKHAWYIRFENDLKMFLYIEKEIKNFFLELEKKENLKKQRKVNAAEYRNKIKVGDIFHTSWGYNATNVDFFQVVSRPTAASAVIRKIDYEWESGNYMAGYIKPIKDSFISEEKKCRIDHYGNICKADEYGHKAYATLPNRKHFVSSD